MVIFNSYFDITRGYQKTGKPSVFPIEILGFEPAKPQESTDLNMLECAKATVDLGWGFYMAWGLLSASMYIYIYTYQYSNVQYHIISHTIVIIIITMN